VFLLFANILNLISHSRARLSTDCALLRGVLTYYTPLDLTENTSNKQTL